MNKFRYGIGTCESCGSIVRDLELIHKQLHGEFVSMYVCSECAKQHERELEMTRQNYQAQFGENWH